MSQCMSLRQFLGKAREALRQGLNSRTKLTLVIGNESADLDSITSSLLYSYVRTLSAKANGQTYVPLINIPTADLRLRPELFALLPHAGLEAAQLITLDDLPLASLARELPAANTQWTLVDHNVLQGEIGRIYGKQVIGVIDHHDDEHQVPQDTGHEPRIIQKTGSCTSLVVNYLQSQWQALESSDSAPDKRQILPTWSMEAARLASASILIDTANLADENKTTAHDRDAMAFLLPRLGDTEQSSFYTALRQAKQDIGSLALDDVLRKDYKQWQCAGLKLGIASVVKSLEFLGLKAAREQQSEQQLNTKHKSDEANETSQALVDSARNFAEQRGLDVMAIMTTSMSEDGNFQRQLLVRASNRASLRALGKFEATAGKELQLVALARWTAGLAASDIEHVRIWQQRALQHSRKRVAPLLREAIEQSASDSQL